MNSQLRDEQLVQELVGCCHFASTMVDMIRSQFGDALEASLDPEQLEELDTAFRAIISRVDAGIYSARAALAAGWAAQARLAGGVA